MGEIPSETDAIENAMAALRAAIDAAGVSKREIARRIGRAEVAFSNAVARPDEKGMSLAAYSRALYAAGFDLQAIIHSAVAARTRPVPEPLAKALKWLRHSISEQDRSVLLSLSAAGVFDAATIDDILHFHEHLISVRKRETTFWPPIQK